MARNRSVRAAARAFAKRTAGMSRSTLIPSLLVCAGALLAAPAPAQTVNGLVAAYGFASGTSWSTAGKFGNALVFNGTNARVTVPNTASLQLTTAMTLEAWVLPTTAPTGGRASVDKPVDVYSLMASTDNGNRPGVGGTWNDGNKNIFGPTVLPVNTWSHLATTFDGTTVRFFVNGVQVSQD